MTRGHLNLHPVSTTLTDVTLSDHQPDGGPAQECEAGAVEALPILGQPAASVEPGDGSLDDPALRDDYEPLGRIGALDDLDLDLVADLPQSLLELRAGTAPPSCLRRIAARW